MLRSGINHPKEPLIVMGIEARNVQRLKAGQPIVAPIRSFGVNLPGKVVLFYAETEELLLGAIQAAIGPETRGEIDEKLLYEMLAMKDRPNILIATVGLPKSGKTTWAKAQSYPIVNPDAIRLAIHGQRFIAEAEPFVWATAKAMVKALFLAGHKIVVLDATNNTRKRRDDWKSNNWELHLKYFDTSAEICFDRATEENDTEIIPVIERMAAQQEVPQDDEKVWP
jgi:predicted kinase